MNSIGELIGTGHLSAHNFEIRMVETNGNIRTFTYNDNGYIGPVWPIGWFTAGEAIDDWKAVEE